MKKTESAGAQKRVTTRSIASLKQDGVKIACLTAYDFLTAKLPDQAGVDIFLVSFVDMGNSLKRSDHQLAVTSAVSKMGNSRPVMNRLEEWQWDCGS